MPERDPFDALQESWQQAGSPPAVRALDEEDSTTQQAVEWMSNAWQQLEVPTAALPSRHRKVNPWKWMALPAAAALLITLRVFMNTPQPSPDDIAPTDLVASATDSPATAPEPAPAQLLASNTQHVQMRSGKVRLTMLRGNDTSTNQ